MSSFGNVHNFQYQPYWERNVPQRTPNLIWQNCMMQPNYGAPYTHQPRLPTNPQNYGGPHHWRGNPKKPNRKKEPEYVGYCDICDRGFANEATKAQHYQQHVKCEEPDCKFEAHPKIVAIHKRNQHGRNALPKIETPEEIEQWRQERKRNFPTAENIVKKKQMMMERQKNGNVLRNRRFDKMRGRNRLGHKAGFHPHQRRQQNLETERQNCQIPEKISEEPVKSKNLLESQCVDLMEENGVETSDGEPEHLDVKKNITNALGSLMQDYASEEEDDEDTKKLESNEIQTISTEKIQNVSKDSNATLQSCVSSNNTNEDTSIGDVLETKECEFTNQNGRKQARTQYEKNSRKYDSRSSRPTLLEMLLAPEIRQERNIILQCVRYVVQNNFFDVKS